MEHFINLNPNANSKLFFCVILRQIPSSKFHLMMKLKRNTNTALPLHFSIPAKKLQMTVTNLLFNGKLVILYIDFLTDFGSTVKDPAYRLRL
jgi:hypothetical protein